MNRVECLTTIRDGSGVDSLGTNKEPLFVVSLGKTRIAWHSLYEGDGSMYLHSMGYTTPYALGLALALPKRKVVAIDGDGSLFLNLGVLTTIAAADPANLTVVIIDNEMYEATGKFPTASAKKASLEQIARGCGIANAFTLKDTKSLGKAYRDALTGKGPFFMDVKVQDEDLRIPSSTMDGKENKYRFVRHIERTEGIRVFEPPSTQG